VAFQSGISQEAWMTTLPSSLTRTLSEPSFEQRLEAHPRRMELRDGKIEQCAPAGGESDAIAPDDTERHAGHAMALGKLFEPRSLPRRHDHARR
jgi:hypothetical protein